MLTRLARTTAFRGSAEGTIVLDANGRACPTDAATAHFLRWWSGLRLKDGELSAAHRGEDRMLRRMIALAATGTDGVFAMRGPDGMKSVQVVLLALAGGGVALHLKAPMHRSGPPELFMRRHYGLSPREAELAVRFVEGANLLEAAERMAIGGHAARALQSRVLARTGTTSPAGLRRLFDTILA